MTIDKIATIAARRFPRRCLAALTGFGVVALSAMVLALPAQAQDCFAGKPGKVTYDDGRTITIIQRHGDDLTYTTPYEGFQDSVLKTHLMLFPKQGRAGARSTEYRWTSRLPRLADMVPGYQFDLKGTMKSGDGKALPYRNVGEVLGSEEVKLGDCSYAALVIRLDTWLNDELLIISTVHLSPDLMIILQSKAVPVSASTQIISTAVAIE